MSLRHLNIAPRAFIGFAFIAVLVVLLGVFAVNRMTQMRQSSQDMSANQLPSMTHLGTITENVLRRFLDPAPFPTSPDTDGARP